jgi:hypothetical protein
VPAAKRKAPSPPARSLRIVDATDASEREADRVANEIMSSSPARLHWSLSEVRIGAPLQRKCDCGSGSATGECEACKKKEEEQKVQRKASPAGAPAFAPPIVHNVLNSPGQPLDRATRGFFEPRLGSDLGRVRVHFDARAADSAKAVGAHAYTVGNNIVFGAGRYSPGSSEGRKLLAHELAHIVQQGPLLYRQPDEGGGMVDRPLPPHDPHPKFSPVGACYGSAICRDLITPTKLLQQTEGDPVNEEKRKRRKELCQKRPPDSACTEDGHGALARQTAKLLHDYDPRRPAPGVKILIDKDLPGTFGALTMRCSQFMPPVTGATDCITVPEQVEQQAAEFNNTMHPQIGGTERGKWRERTLEILVHESEHTRFRAAARKNQLPEIMGGAPAHFPFLSGCATEDTFLAMNELSAMLTEFALRMDRIRTSVDLSPEDREKELEEWREHRILGTKQSITVSLRTVRCACNCDDANKMIREAVEFTTASGTQQQKNELHREMRDPRWSDLDLRWPFVAPPVPSVSRP